MIAIITYNTPHRKTQDLLWQLLLRERRDLHLLALPWVYRKPHPAVYEHRPSAAFEAGPEQLCRQFGWGFEPCEASDLVRALRSLQPDHVLIAGAGLLPAELPEAFPVINAHPGYLPLVRGLDALKWALLHDRPIGVSTHFISAAADEGILIERREASLYREDTFHSLAYRQYELEITMLADAPGVVERKEVLGENLSDERFIATRRMPAAMETEMMAAFERRRSAAPSRWEV